MSNTISEPEAEQETINFTMKNSWDTKFQLIKAFVNHNVKTGMIKHLDDYRIIRNLFTHGDGTITHSYIKRFNKSDTQLGRRLKLSCNLVFLYYSIITVVLTEFDDVLVKEFSELIFQV